MWLAFGNFIHCLDVGEKDYKTASNLNLVSISGGMHISHEFTSNGYEKVNHMPIVVVGLV